MVPKFAFSPAENDAAMPSATAIWSTLRFSRREAAATVPKIPSVAVGCQPFS